MRRAGNLDEKSAPRGLAGKWNQRIANRRHAPGLSASIRSMATHAVEHVIDMRLVSSRSAGVQQRGERSHLLRNRNDASRRAVIGNVGLAISRAPIVVVGLERNVQRCVALISIAHASAARRLAAAVVVRDDIVLSIERVVTSSYPCDRGHLGAGRTGVLRSSAAATKIPVDGAVAPVVATGWIIDLLGLLVRLWGAAWRRGPPATRALRQPRPAEPPGTPPCCGGKCA